MAYKPTNKDVSEAKAWLRRRVEAEASMSKNLYDILLMYAKMLLAIYVKYGYSVNNPNALDNPELKAEVKKLLDKLKRELEDDCEMLCLYADEERRDFILPLIHGEVYGMTLTSRIDSWVNDFSRFVANMAITGHIAISTLPMKVGAMSGLDRLLRHTISIAFMQVWLDKHRNAIGFYSQRGSSYPCAQCDGEIGYHPISEYPLGGWHPNCVCIFTFVYQ